MMSPHDTLSRDAFFILLVLTEDPLHGSGIARKVRERSAGEVKLWPVSLYGRLDELRDLGLIQELDDEDHPDGASRRRRYYRITPEGATRLRREGERLAGLGALAIHAAGERHA